MAHVRCVDNFSKVFRKSIPTASSGTFKSCLWTGYAAFVVHDPTVKTALFATPSGRILPGMALDPCVTANVTHVNDGLTYMHACRYANLL